MRTLCAILLLGVVTYVQADDHACAPYAVKVEESPTNPNTANRSKQVLSLRTFLEKEIDTFYTIKATHYQYNSAACTGTTHGSNCAGVEYTRKFIEDHHEYDEDLLLEAIQFNIVFAGYNKALKYAIEYKMRMGAVDKNYYIFKLLSEKYLEANKISNVNNPANSKLPIRKLDNKISDILKMEYALFRYRKEEYYIFVTCNLEHAWITYVDKTPITTNEISNLDDINSWKRNIGEESSELQEDINSLKRLAAENGKNLELKNIDMLFPANLSNYIRKYFVPKDSAANQNVKSPESSSSTSIRRNP